jgi:hypothetical protein
VRATPGPVALLAAVLLVAPRAAEPGEPPASQRAYTGWTAVTGGYRFIDLDGSREKYREDYNLRSGARLFDFTMDTTASSPESTRLDRLHIDVETPGNEPVSRFRLVASDRALYDFKINFIRSKYQYAVPQLWEGPVTGDVGLDDPHDFSIVRTNGAVDLTVRPPTLPPVHFGYRLYGRDANGNTISTVRIPGGDTFLVSAPSLSTTNVGVVDTTFDLWQTSVFLQQEYRRTTRDRTLRDPLDPVGLDPGDASSLEFYRSDRNEEIVTPATRVRLRRALGDVVDLSAGYVFSHGDLDAGFERARRGTDRGGGFAGDALASSRSDAALTTHVLDAAASVRLHDRVRLHTGYRYDSRDQDGTLNETGDFGFLRAHTDDDVRLHRASVELEVEPLPALLVRGGAGYTRRWARLALDPDSVTTESVGALGSIRYRPWSFLDLSAAYENVQVDDPYVVAGDPTNVPPLPDRETSFDLVNRGSAGVGIRPLEWIELRYRLQADNRENDDFSGCTWTLANSVSFSLTPVTGLTIFAGYTLRELDQRADILVAPLYEPATASMQDGTEQVLSSVLRYDFEVLRHRWAAGWSVYFVDSDSALRPRLETDDGSRTEFDLDRIDGGAFVTLLHRWLEPTLEFRMIDYHQSPLTENDYRATIVGLRLTKRLDF